MSEDDLGTAVGLPRPPRRVVSLVPSLTEALAETVPERLVGATDWCTHPAGLDVVVRALPAAAAAGWDELGRDYRDALHAALRKAR